MGAKAAMMACMLLLAIATLAKAGERVADVKPFSRLPKAEALLKECSSSVEQARAIVYSLPERVDWKIIVVCDEISWLWEALDAGVYAQTITAWTDVRRTGPHPGFTTYIRGLCFREHLKGGPEFTLAHELGHIVTRSAVESDADEWARQVLAAPRPRKK